MRVIILICLLPFILVSCLDHGNKSVENNLKNINLIADTNAYAARLMLDTLNINEEKLSKQNKMRFNLLQLKLQDKAISLQSYQYIEYIEVIDSIIDFFEGRNDNETLGEAMFYKGRIFAEIGNENEAIEQFNLAKYLLKDSKRYYLMSIIGSQLSFIYNNMNVVDKALQEDYFSWKAALKTGDVNYIAHFENAILSEYIQRDSLKKAEFHLNNLLNNYQLKDSSALKTRILIQMAYLRTKQHRYREADSILVKVAGLPDSGDQEAFNYISALLYSNWGNTEKSKVFYLKMMNEGVWPDNRLAFNKMLTMAEKNKDWELIKEVSKASHRIDSLEKKAYGYEKTNQIDNIEYIIKKNDSQKLIIKGLERKRNLELAIIIMASAIIVALSVILLKNKIKTKLETENDNDQAISPNDDSTATEKQANNVKKKVKIPDAPEKYLEIQLLKEISKRTGYRLKESDWEIIEKEIKELDREFYDKFLGLGLNDIEWRMSLLLKANIKPSAISTMIGRTPSAIAKMRKGACYKILDVETCTPSKWDEFVARS